MHHARRFFILLFAVVLVGCGGGGDSNDNEAPPDNASQQYRVFTGNANHHVILDGAATQFAVRRSDDKLVHLPSGSPLNQLLFVEGGSILREGQKIGAIVLVPGQDGKEIAALTCSGPAPNYGAMTITVSAQGWTHSCASNPSGGGGDDQSGPSTPTYVSWVGNANGKAILDGSNRRFGVNQATRVVHDLSTHVSLNGLTVENAQVFALGSLVGSVVLAPGENNSNVAVFRCTNGNTMQITQTQDQWHFDCGTVSGSGGNPPSTSGGSGGGSTPPGSTPVVDWKLESQGSLPGNPFSRYQVTVRNTGNVRTSCQVNVSYEAIDGEIIRRDNRTMSAGPIAVGATAQMILSLANRNFTFIGINSISCTRWPFD